MLLALAGAGLVTALPPARSEALRLLHLSREPLSRQAAVSLSAERERRPAGAADALAPIGVLYPAGESVAAHFCTGEVVDSPRHDLVVTAAHCLAGVGAIRFAPGYRRGRTPFGTWAVVASFVDSAWRRAADPDHDFAFLVVAPRHGVEIQALTGAERIGEPGPAIGASVR
ncbi:MAG TPA: hypothetical protein VKU92_02370, partial [Acidimicrobiales bacterium]|nr:hypothetical protein [Acidimicrobiales bacterium]